MSRAVFLERRVYRQRRLIDAMRFLPFLGLWLFIMPAVIKTDASTSGLIAYFFGIWCVLIILVAVFATRHRRQSARDADLDRIR